MATIGDGNKIGDILHHIHIFGTYYLALSGQAQCSGNTRLKSKARLDSNAMLKINTRLDSKAWLLRHGIALIR